MQLSSTFCRMQETHQRDRAANATLENVRAVADRAASARGVSRRTPQSGAKPPASRHASLHRCWLFKMNGNRAMRTDC